MSMKDTGDSDYRESYRRRSRLEIYLEVLRQVKNGTRKPTHIMYATNMSYRPLREILTSMVSDGFIREIEEKRDKRTTSYYEIAQRGLNVLSYLDREVFQMLMESAQKRGSNGSIMQIINP